MKKLSHPNLLTALSNMTIESDGAQLTFVKRLARDNGWSLPFADRVYQEYLRFLYLAKTCDHGVTPSDEVDQVWHQHLTYTRHYWNELCGEILGSPLHHGPTKGGASEKDKYQQQYRQTLETYRATFGETPPADIWPHLERRFGATYQRLESGRYLMIPKNAAYTILPLAALAGCTASERTANLFWIIGVAVMTYSVINWFKSRTRRRSKNDGGCSSVSICTDSNGSDSGCGGGCGGGCS
jgi:hypothetical protein